MSKVTEKRKEEHININLEQNVQFPNLTTGLEKYRLPHRAIPEINLSDVDTSVTIFGKLLQTPLFISSMTGGTDRAMKINEHLARAAQDYGMAMGVGSQRAAIEDDSLAKTFAIRHLAPDALLFANIGAVQLNYGYGLEQCKKAIDMLEADALILHFNVLQEAVQPEGDTSFAGLIDKTAEVCSSLPVPVIAKEVGWGFSPQDVQMLIDAGFSAIDVAGAGGTSWSEVEYHRAPSAFHAQVASAFSDWGIPTTDAIQNVREISKTLPCFASGGIRTGIDIAKCVALGADLAGIAGSFLKAADQSYDAVTEFVNIIQKQLQVAMQCSGVPDIDSLRNLDLLSVR